jgi:lipid-binding SYLF domain-containing protein
MSTERRTIGALAIALGMMLGGSPLAYADTAAEISRDAREALDDLYASTPAARALGGRAHAVLVFPSILKGGFIFGAQVGEGALLRRGRVEGYYVTTGASYGFQAGLQTYGYALFFMTSGALRYLDQSAGFQLGAGPSLVVVDSGFAKSFDTSTARGDIFAFVFDQTGLMGGVGLQGTKITRINPD